MTYEEKYKKALEWMREVYPTLQGAAKEDAEYYFPELKESEDERIREELIETIHLAYDCGCSLNKEQRDKYLAWLEKQAQKPADEVEPKFHAGEWVVFEYWEETATLQITRIVGETYVFSDDSTLGVVNEDTLRLWDITKDAKDGDVLVCESGWTCIFKKLNHNSFGEILFDSYCFIDRTGWFCDGAKGHTLNERINGKIYPATKEQGDLLFAKMKEAGYEWDAEKKELKTIEQNSTDEIGSYDHGKVLESLMSAKMKTPEESLGIDSETYSEIIDECIYGEQKPAWSEEDEKLVKNLISTLSNLYARNLIEKETKEKYTNWLKSLRPQNRQEWNSKDKKIKNEIVNYFTCQCKDEPTRIKTLNRWICWLNALENSSVIKPMPEFDEWLKQIWDILDWAEEKGRITYSTWEDYTGWLSLLNPKNRWKPSDAQMASITCAVRKMKESACCDSELVSLLNDLKKLKE